MRRIERFSTHRAIIPRLTGIQAGAIAGLAGGLAMMIVGLLLSLASGQSIWLPPRCIAALVYGAAAMADTGLSLAPVAVGTAIHLLTSVAFGIVFRLAYSRIAHPSLRCSLSICLGLAYGLLLWLIAIVCVVPRLDPWLAEIAPLAFLLQHLAYGAMLGLVCPPLAERGNAAWLAALRGPQPDQAIADLRAIVVHRLRAALAGRVPGDLDMLIEDCAQDALVQILRSMDSFRGESRFTTWAQTIAVNLAFTELRHRRWRDCSIQDLLCNEADLDHAPALVTAAGPEQQTIRQVLLELVHRVLMEELTQCQRQAMLAVLDDGVPMDEVAQRLGTNRNALYKALHDARQHVRKRLRAEGLSPQEILAAWSD